MFNPTSRMLKGEAIPVYNNGDMIRDFTYIDDITDGVVKIAESVGGAEPYKIYNIGRGEQVKLMEFIERMSEHLGVPANINMLPMQDGDVPRTMAKTDELQRDFGYAPSISVDEGVTGTIATVSATAGDGPTTYSIVAGNPAEVIGYRFEQKVIGELIESEWWNWSEEKILNNEDFFKNKLF